eukprot:2436757-Pleurochrysis_carterae.AAC.2
MHAHERVWRRGSVVGQPCDSVGCSRAGLRARAPVRPCARAPVRLRACMCVMCVACLCAVWVPVPRTRMHACTSTQAPLCTRRQRLRRALTKHLRSTVPNRKCLVEARAN